MSSVAAARRIRDLPGPPGLPLVGNLLEVDSTRLHTVAEAWARTYGDLFRFRIAGREFFVVADPEVIAAALRDRPDTFARTARLSATSQEMGFGGLFSANGAAWRRQRPMVMASFDPGHIKSYFPTLVKVTERFARRWATAAAARSAIDLQADLMRYTVDVTAGLAFGVDINTLESDREIIQQHLDKVFPALFKRLMAPVEYWRWLKLPSDRALERHLAELQRAVGGFISEARARMAAQPELRKDPRNLIEAMIAARDTEGSGVNDEDVAGNVLTMLLAGEDTTANTLAWMIYLLSRNPASLERAMNEVRAVLRERRIPESHEQLAALAYVDACIQETMRLKPVAPVIMLQASRDTVLGGVQVPAGQLVMCLMRPGAMDEGNFPAAASFSPERWLASGSRSMASAKRVAMPFGAGPRLCPGRYLAVLEMKMVMAMLLAGFDIGAVETPDGGEAREHLALTMSPVGLRLRLSPRGP